MTLYYSQLFMHDTNASRDALNDDLDKIAECIYISAENAIQPYLE